MDEAEHEAISSPIDYDFDRHVLAVQSDVVSLWPDSTGATVSQISSDFGQAREAYSEFVNEP